MKFAIDEHIQLSPSAITLNFAQRFPYAVIYLSGWVKNGTFFEIKPIVTEYDILVTNIFGAYIPNRIQFRAISSKIEVVAEYSDFRVKLCFDMFEFLLGAQDTKECLVRNCNYYVSPEANEKNEGRIESTVAGLRDSMISYWLGESGLAVA